MRILIATDAWPPQINGVVVALANTISRLRRLGHQVQVISPEGPIGAAARRYCLKRGLRFTTAYHTCFPEYIQLRTGVPLAWTYAWMRRFHAPAANVVVATSTMRETLAARGFERLFECPLGVDLDLLRPSDERFTEFLRPVFTYVGRVAPEKNLAEFLALDLPGTKLVVGDGPARARLEKRFPAARFVGYKTGAELASHYQRSDVFVFPSRTETFGLVMLEAMACGVPVAAFPVRGPLDVVKDPATGVLDTDLRRAALRALELQRGRGRAYSEQFPWDASCERFLSHLVPAAPSGRSSSARMLGNAAD